MIRGRQNTEAPVDSTATYKVGDSKSTQANDSKEAVRYSAIDLWKEAPVLTGQVARYEEDIVKKAKQPNFILQGQVELNKLQTKIQETSPLYTEKPIEERKEMLKAALMKVVGGPGPLLVEEFAKLDDERRPYYWNNIVRYPLTTFDVDFLSIQTRVNPCLAMWLRNLPSSQQKEIKQLFYDYGFPVTKNHKHSDTTK